VSQANHWYVYPVVVATPVGHKPTSTVMMLLAVVVVEARRTSLEVLLVAVRTGAAATAWLLTVKRVTDVEIAAFIAETLSVRNLLNCAVVGVNVIAVAPVIAVQPTGVVETTDATRLVQLNHW
jgi:hypothetical protein